MAADAGVSAGVVLAGLLILLTGWVWLDPAVKHGDWRCDRREHLGAVARIDRPGNGCGAGGVAQEAVQDYLASVPGVLEVHDLHIWGLSTTADGADGASRVHRCIGGANAA